jgi:hypothetical protein
MEKGQKELVTGHNEANGSTTASESVAYKKGTVPI